MASRPEPTLGRIVTALTARSEPVVQRGDGVAWHAATALVLHEDERRGVEGLFIKRVERAGDPWSGHMALPGGKREPGDDSLLETARRETAEEVGVVLTDPPVARLDDQGGRVHRGRVATFVWTLDTRPDTTPEAAEVAEAVWIPLRVFLDPAARARHPLPGVGPFPAVVWNGYTVWGLTHRTMQDFFTAVDHPMP